MRTDLNQHSCKNHFLELDPSIKKNARKSAWVLVITLLMMGLEITFGHITGSMALLADGWHMSTHALAIGITFLTYRLATHPEIAKRFNFGGGKLLALGGFTSAVILVAVFGLITKESVERFIHPQAIDFTEALFVAGLGFVVNVVSAFILHDHGHSHGHGGHSHSEHDHHDHSDHAHSHGDHDHSHNHKPKRDHNIRAAYIHVIADAVTSVGAIIALMLGKLFGWGFLDPLIGVVGAIVILSWSITLIRDTGWELLDGHARHINYDKLRRRLESEGAHIQDLHVWNVSPHVVACELVVESKQRHGIEFYRKILEREFLIHHSVIEERA